MISRRERVLKTIRGEATDRPPKGEILIENGFIKKFGLSSLLELVKILNMDLLTLKVEDLPNWQYFKDRDLYTVGLFSGPFSSIFNKYSLKELSLLIVKDANEAKRLMAEGLKSSKSLLFQSLDEGLDAVLIADDIAAKGGTLFSPLFLSRYYFPLLAELINEIRYKGFKAPVLFHSDGNLNSILVSLRDSGFNGLQCLESSSNMGPIPFAYGDFPDWIYWGNYEFEENENLKTPVDVALEITGHLYRWHDIGGYIFGSTGGLYQALDPQAVLTAYKVVDKGYKNPDREVIVKK